MKRLIILLTIAAAAILSAHAEEKTKTYRFNEITGIEAGNCYNIYVNYGRSKEVKVVYDSEIENYIVIRHSDAESKLHLGLEKLPRKFLSGDRQTISVYIEMDEISEIDLSGAASITFSGEFKASALDIDLSGASNIKSLNVNGRSLTLDCSGASKASINGSFSEDTELELSGASFIEFNGKTQTMETGLSGASNLKGSAKTKSCSVDCSGASKISMSGETGQLSVEGSGACSIDLKDMVADNASISLSGACRAKVNAVKEIRYDVSRASKMTYYGDARMVNISSETNIVKGM